MLIIILILIKVDKVEGGGGSPNVYEKILNVNIINFAKVNKGGGGGKTLFPQKRTTRRLPQNNPCLTKKYNNITTLVRLT